jgi:hypothetical protein
MGVGIPPVARRIVLACDAFAVYLAGGSEVRWRFAPRAPTRARYESLPAFAVR